MSIAAEKDLAPGRGATREHTLDGSVTEEQRRPGAKDSQPARVIAETDGPLRCSSLTPEHARQSLTDHLTAKAEEIRQKYGPRIGGSELLRLLEDRTQVRYPCEIGFDARPLRSGEFAHPVEKGPRPEDGFVMFVHPYFRDKPEALPFLVLYQLVVVNYGSLATPENAEEFGARALGLSVDEYYRILCALADEMGSFAS